MDSLTQIILGAAVGEVTAGKKLGNRAMVWGAIAGTIPDLDVFVGKLLSPTGSLAFHRGITHSIFFAITFSFLIAMACHRYYNNDYHKSKPIKILSSIFMILFFGGLVVGGLFMFKVSLLFTYILGGLIAIAGGLALWVFIRDYLLTPSSDVKIPLKTWYTLFFWAIFTHPLLDCFTSYGTQLFLPFSNYRVAFNTISVADPLYTIPFLFLLIAASMYRRNSRTRSWLNWAGIGISSIYMLFTVFNKLHTDQVMEDTLHEEKIAYNRYMTMPSILNNILWMGTAETDSLYYFGQYSMLDKEQRFKLRPMAKNHYLIKDIKGDYTIETLQWFTNGYYGVTALPDGNLQINDMRFGILNEKEGKKNYSMSFVVYKDAKGNYQLTSNRPDRKGMDIKSFALDMWERIKGI